MYKNYIDVSIFFLSNNIVNTCEKKEKSTLLMPQKQDKCSVIVPVEYLDDRYFDPYIA